MSGNDARRLPTLLTEKAVLTEFLNLYKGFPCLWDQKHMLYNNKEARQQAYDVLLEKYKVIEEDATVADVKKRIEHMRCAYRREHKKVISIRLRGGGTHIPVLWYYNLLTFLNDHHHNNDSLFKSHCWEQASSHQERAWATDPTRAQCGSGTSLNDHNEIKTDSQYDDTYQIEETHEIVDSDDDEPDVKKIKTYSHNALYVSENQSDEGEDLSEQQDQDYQNCIVKDGPEAFGRTVGYQLKELTHIQRIYAEKLISDVIFQARLGKLNAESTIDLNDSDT